MACSLWWCWGHSDVQRGPIKEEEQTEQSQRSQPAGGLGEGARRPRYPVDQGWGLPPSVVVRQPLCL